MKMNHTTYQKIQKQSSRLQIGNLFYKALFIKGTREVISTNENKRCIAIDRILNTCIRAYASTPMIYKNNTVITTIHHCLQKE